METFAKVIGSIIGIAVVVAVILLIPAVWVAVGWIIGTIISIFFGGMVSEGLNVIFGTNRFTAGDIPLVTAVLALISMIFVRIKVGGNDE